MLMVALQVRIMSDEAVKGQEATDQCDDAFLKKIESSMLSQVKLQGIQGIKKVTIRSVDRLVVRPEVGQGYFKEDEWMLDTEGVNLQEVGSHPDPHILHHAILLHCQSVQVLRQQGISKAKTKKRPEA